MPRKKLTRRQMLLNAAKRQMMESGEIDCRNDTRPVPGTLEELYAQINQEDFDGCLPEGLPILWNPRLRRALGKAFYSATSKGKKRGHREGCTPVKIEMRSGWDWTDRFMRKVLTHEMCHCWAYQEHGEVGHGKRFWKKMRSLGYMEGHRFPFQTANEADKYCV